MGHRLVKFESSRTNFMKPNFRSLKHASILYFVKGGWSDGDIKGLIKAKDFVDLDTEIYDFAIQVGERKGYGDDGTFELKEEFLSDIATLAESQWPDDMS